MRSPWLLDGVDLALSPGEVVGLAGLSGTGKTTLAMILAGYLQPTSGRVSLDDERLPTCGYRPVQLVFQHPELTINPHFRISKALAEGGEDASELAGALGLRREWLSRFPHELSGGELQRIALARALGRKTRFLIADETTAMLDSITQASLWRYLLRTIEDRRIGLLAISHDAALLHRVAQRTIDITALQKAKLPGPMLVLASARAPRERGSNDQ